MSLRVQACADNASQYGFMGTAQECTVLARFTIAALPSGGSGRGAMIYNWGDNASGNLNPMVKLRVDGKLEVSTDPFGTGTIGTAVLTTSTEYDITVTRTITSIVGGTITGVVKVYVNGTLDINAGSFTWLDHPGSAPAARFSVLGDNGSGAFMDDTYDIYADGLKVWSRALTLSEINAERGHYEVVSLTNALCNVPFIDNHLDRLEGGTPTGTGAEDTYPVDFADGGTHTIAGPALVSMAPRPHTSIVSSKTPSRLYFVPAAIDAANSFSFAAWISAKDAGSANDWTIFNIGTGSTDDFSQLYVNMGEIHVYHNGDDSGGVAASFSARDHIAMTGQVSGADIEHKVYLNGTLVLTHTATGKVTGDTGLALWLLCTQTGEQPGSAVPWEMSNARFKKGVIWTPTQIAAEMASNAAVNPVDGSWTFNTESLVDESGHSNDIQIDADIARYIWGAPTFASASTPKSAGFWMAA